MTTMTRTRHLLPGLRPEPLASYLAGLGLIRVLGEQTDNNATAAWTPDGLALTTHVDDIAQWLADDYQPTPVLSPWNGGSGFGAKDKEPLRRLDSLRRNASPRLASLNAAIDIANAVISKARTRGWITDAGVADKPAIVTEFRNTCPDELLPWIDAAIVLADNEAFFSPILGTGGNDGRLEFSTNFHQQLIELVGSTSDRDRARALAAARDLLAGTQQAALSDVPIGQFDPGSAGGPGSSRFGAADTLANPWSYVLVIEGAVLFAASAARRNQHGAGRASMPFTVSLSPDGSGSGAADEASRARGELWTPVWHADFTLAEIRQLFAEARASWRGRPARKAVAFYAATRTLGVARGIDEFTRYGLLQRNGLAFTAVPLDRVVVAERPAVQLSAQVEDWATRLGGSEASAAVTEAYRAFQKAHLEFARDGGPFALARMLAAVTTLEMAVGRSGRAREAAGVRFSPPASLFLEVLRDLGEPEFRVASGIASCATWPAEGPARTLRHLLLPIDPAGPGSQPRWRDAPLVPGFGARPLASVLADVLIWRSRTAATDRNAGKFHGVPTFPWGVGVPAADLHAFAGGQLDDTRLDMYLRACLALNWRGSSPGWAAERPEVPVTTLALLHPFAAGLRPANPRDGANDETVPALNPEWASRLASGHSHQVRRVHDEAAARLRQAGGWMTVPAPPARAVPDGIRIAAALVPRCLSPRAVLRVIAFDPAAEDDTARRPAGQEEQDANPVQPEEL